MRALAGGRDFEIAEGDAPLLLLAPHGGRRDPARRPWAAGGLQTNDLHTADLAHVLAERLGATALVNRTLDRNDVDLNRLATAVEQAPRFLELLADLLDARLRRHGRMVVLAVHGWNVVQPVVDVGVGFRPGRHAPGQPPGPTASRRFVTGGLARLGAALAERGMTASLGARYPARGRENLLQLFTTRYLDDGRPLVRRLAMLGRRCDAAQLELGIPLRWPGPWRDGVVAALAESLPALLDPPAHEDAAPPPPFARAEAAGIGLEFVAGGWCGLAAFDAAGGRLLLVDEAGSLVVFTGERIGPGDGPGQVGSLGLEAAADGAVRLRYAGPMLRFPDTTPFLDLEAGLAHARLVQADVELLFSPSHAPDCPFGAVTGWVVVGDGRTRIAGFAARHAGDAPAQPGARLALRLGPREHLLLRPGPGASSGFLCRQGRHTAVEEVRVGRDPAARALEVVARLAGGGERTLRAAEAHRLPVVRGGSTPPRRVEFTALRLVGSAAWAGWGFSGTARPDA